MISDRNVEILLLTHGGWGEMLIEKISMIVGPVENVSEIALLPTDSPETFLERVEEKIKEMAEGSLVITDIMGGTTSNVALRLSLEYKIYVLSGLNSMMLIEAIMKKNTPFTINDVKAIENAAKENCRHLEIKI